jgi:hypothetical protein
MACAIAKRSEAYALSSQLRIHHFDFLQDEMSGSASRRRARLHNDFRCPFRWLFCRSQRDQHYPDD